MFLNFTGRFGSRQTVAEETLQIGLRTVPLRVVRNPRARRYFLRVQADGSARLTIPRGGSRSEARSFVERHREWLERQFHELQSQPRGPLAWQVGTDILFRGELVRIEAEVGGNIKFGPKIMFCNDTERDLRPEIEEYLRSLAARELPVRVRELAAQHHFSVRRVTVRNQRRRWGSCSRGGNISLNWRLIQTPPFARDYIILHELAHLRQMNHSARFWREVERLCPDYQAAEQWFKVNRRLLG